MLAMVVAASIAYALGLLILVEFDPLFLLWLRDPGVDPILFDVESLRLT